MLVICVLVWVVCGCVGVGVGVVKPCVSPQAEPPSQTPKTTTSTHVVGGAADFSAGDLVLELLGQVRVGRQVVVPVVGLGVCTWGETMKKRGGGYIQPRDLLRPACSRASTKTCTRTHAHVRLDVLAQRHQRRGHVVGVQEVGVRLPKDEDADEGHLFVRRLSFVIIVAVVVVAVMGFG